jgi:hypothetical protein
MEVTMSDLRHSTRALLSSIALSAAVLVAGCMVGPPTPIEWLLECHGPACEYSPGPWVRSNAAEIAADGGEITVPFLCRPPKVTRNQMRAIAYTLATGAWRAVSVHAPTSSASHSSIRAVRGDPHAIRNCAADCSRFAYLARVSTKSRPGYPSDEFYEVFYSDNGKVRQLTNLDDSNVKYSHVEMSADARKVLVQSNISEKLALVDVESGAVTDVPLRDAIWKDCTSR